MEIINHQNKGVLFQIEGNVASSKQFFITDEKSHFIRGSLYFKSTINDSILPIESFFANDIIHIMETANFN